MKIIDFFNSCSFLKLFSYVSSMFPLSIYLLLSYFNSNNNISCIKYLSPRIISITIFIFEIISIIYVILFYFYLLKIISKNKCKSVMIDDPVQEKTNTSNYLLANVLPIVTLNYNDIHTDIFTIILIFTLGFIYIKNNLYYINPLYDILNIKVYNCKVVYQGGTVKNPISKRRTVISNFNLYDFKNSNFLIFEVVDMIFVIKELNN